MSFTLTIQINTINGSLKLFYLFSWLKNENEHHYIKSPSLEAQLQKTKIYKSWLHSHLPFLSICISSLEIQLPHCFQWKNNILCPLPRLSLCSILIFPHSLCQNLTVFLCFDYFFPKSNLLHKEFNAQFPWCFVKWTLGLWNPYSPKTFFSFAHYRFSLFVNSTQNLVSKMLCIASNAHIFPLISLYDCTFCISHFPYWTGQGVWTPLGIQLFYST